MQSLNLRTPHDVAQKQKCTKEEKGALLSQGLEAAVNGDVSSLPDRAVFFSGSKEKKSAEGYCKQNAGTNNVCMTEALAQFNALELFKYIPPMTIKEIYDLGDIISERFAQEASGNVTAFIGPAIKPHGTFLCIELPALIANEKVTSINGSPKENYMYLLEGCGKSFRDISLAEKRFDA